MASSSYTAEQALTGYLYQIRLALLYSLKFLQKRVHDDAIFYVGIENYDDISFENAQGGLERVIQTKYHAASSGTLTDSSVDLWRSIRIWISIFQEKKEALPLFYLLTTAKLLKNSATALLADEERAQANKIRSQDKEEKILAMLEKAANNSRNFLYSAFRLAPPLCACRISSTFIRIRWMMSLAKSSTCWLSLCPSSPGTNQ